MKTKEIKHRTRTGKLNFSITSNDTFLGFHRTANSVGELLQVISNKLKNTWEIIEFRNDEGKRVCITRSFMDDDGMTVDETIIDWLENVDDKELNERITAMGPEWGVTLEW